MARHSEKAKEYTERIEGMNWSDIAALWERVKRGDTSDWDAGKAFEYLIVRGFKLNDYMADYPYDVPPGGQLIEQIDGIVYMGCLAFMIECKDKDKDNIEPIAKLMAQLSRRAQTTFGCVFTTGGFTSPMLVSMDWLVPHRILLWTELDVDTCIANKDFANALWEKYRNLCKYGLTDHSPHYKDLEIQ